MKNRTIITAMVAAIASFVLADVASAYYSPRMGRFLSRDPIDEPGDVLLRSAEKQPTQFVPRDPIETNTYVGMRNNPISWFDPNGGQATTQPAPLPAPTKKPRECKQGFPSGPESWYVNSAAWCRDSDRGASQHQINGKKWTCYREKTVSTGTTDLASAVVGGPISDFVRRALCGSCPQARHVCFDEEGNCDQEHTDDIGVAYTSRSPGESCSYSWACAVRHWSTGSTYH